MSKRIAIIGAGPIGLEAAAYARIAGFDVVVTERNEIGSNISAWGFAHMFTPWRLNTTPLGRAAVGEDPLLRSFQCPTGHEFVERYLVPLADSELLDGCVDTGINVLSVGREEPGPDGGPGRFRLLVCDRFGVEQEDHADIILDCSGTYGNRRWAGRGGMPAVGEAGVKSSLWYKVPDVLGADRVRFENRRTLLIGAGTSALTVLMHLANIAVGSPQTRVVWIVQKPEELLTLSGEDPLPQRKAMTESGLRMLKNPPAWLEVVKGATVVKMDTSSGLRVWLQRGTETIERQVDEIVAAVGFRPDESIFEPLETRPAYTNAATTRAALQARDLADGAAVDDGISHVIPTVGPDFYLLGHKSFGYNSNFLLRAGHQQIRDVFRLITGDPAFDLYAANPEAAASR